MGAESNSKVAVITKPRWASVQPPSDRFLSICMNARRRNFGARAFQD
jgi:hypothetical protein